MHLMITSESISFLNIIYIVNIPQRCPHLPHILLSERLSRFRDTRTYCHAPIVSHIPSQGLSRFRDTRTYCYALRYHQPQDLPSRSRPFVHEGIRKIEFYTKIHRFLTRNLNDFHLKHEKHNRIFKKKSLKSSGPSSTYNREMNKSTEIYDRFVEG